MLRVLNHSERRVVTPQTHDFKSFVAKHLTTVHAALALTFISLPKAMRLPAFLAGLWRVLTMQTPGILNLPVLLTSLVTSSARASKTLAISDFFASHAVAKASAMPLFDIARTPFFIAFFIAFIAFFAIACWSNYLDKCH